MIVVMIVVGCPACFDNTRLRAGRPSHKTIKMILQLCHTKQMGCQSKKIGWLFASLESGES
jgi:hypothetical protein